jgi:putative ABC transport system permease protein
MNDQKGCVIGQKLAERLGKKVGDRMTLRGTIWSKPDGPIWEFNIRGIYTSPNPNFDQTMMIFHFKYFDEARDVEKGRAGFYIIALRDPAQAANVSAAVDQRFANSPSETRTMTEKAFNSQFLSMMGNLELLFRSIGSAVVLTMLLVAANTMMMSARDRTREMGILKALGFTDERVFALLLGESILIASVGAAIGIGGSWMIFNLFSVNPKPDFFPVFKIPPMSLLAAFGIALGTGAISGLIPGLAALRLKPTEAIKSV